MYCTEERPDIINDTGAHNIATDLMENKEESETSLQIMNFMSVSSVIGAEALIGDTLQKPNHIKSLGWFLRREKRSTRIKTSRS